MTGRSARVLLLNPPAPSPVFRDCYCSVPSKGGLFLHPLDLVLQSGYFSGNRFALQFIDAVFERTAPKPAMRRIVAFAPDAVLSLVGTATLDDDAQFLEALKQEIPRTRMVVSGDLPRFFPDRAFHAIPAADAILMDFTSPGFHRYVLGRPAPPDLRTRNDPGSGRPRLQGNYHHPVPDPAVTRRYAYRLPFFRHPRFYSVAASFGCPFGCAYCNTHVLGYRTRSIGDFIDELRAAKRIGYRSLYVRDATFFFDRQRAMALLRAWRKSGLAFEWMGFTRPDLIDAELAEMAAETGCRLMMLGVESFDDRCLNTLSRKVLPNAVENAVTTLRNYRIASAAQIIFGLQQRPPLTEHRLAAYERSLKRYLRQVDPDYVAVNLYVPRPGVPGVDNRPLRDLDAAHEMLAKRADRLVKWFYRRPRGVFRQLGHIRSLPQAIVQLQSAKGLFLR